jgi:hypothetical protein
MTTHPQENATTLPFEGLEEVYDLLATSLDRVGEENHALFLARLAVTMAHKCNDVDLVREAVAIALDDENNGQNDS